MSEFLLRIPLRIKFTFYIGFVALLCMSLLAGICIAQSISYTEELMHARLAQFASLKSQQIERDVNRQASVLNDAFQGQHFFETMQNLYEGNITVEKWAADIEKVFSNLFATQLRGSQVSNLYDTAGNMLLSMANPNVPVQVIRELEPGMPTLLPLGSSFGNGSNQTEVPINTSSVINQAEAAAANASWSHKTPYSESFLKGQNGYWRTSPLNFTMTPDLIWSWLSEPVPLVNAEGRISAYSYSYTQPLSHLQVNGNVQTTRSLGYITSITDCSKYMNNSNILDFDRSLMTESKTDAMFSIFKADMPKGWRKLFPMGLNSTADRGWHPLSEFPAVMDDIVLENGAMQNRAKKKKGSAVTSSRIPGMKKASVGFSYAKVINRNWFVTISMPQSAVQAGYRRLTKELVGIAIADLVFVVLCAFLLTRLTTSPLHQIYRGMQLHSTGSIESSVKQEKAEPRRPFQLKKLLTFCWNAPFHYFWYSYKSKDGVGAPGSPAYVPSVNDTLVESGLVEDLENRSACSTLNEECWFKVPLPLAPLNRRWIVDELDELIGVYNTMVHRLYVYGARMNDEVRLRTREARESQKSAEAANKAKTIFMMNITNELRTPMNGILGIAAIAFYEKSAPIETLRGRLKTIIASGEVLHELLQQLLNYSTQLTEDEFDYREFTIGALAASILENHSARAETKNIRFEVHSIPSEVQNCIIGSDLGKINIICANLVSNAIKFSDPEKNDHKTAQVSVELYLLDTGNDTLPYAPPKEGSVVKTGEASHPAGSTALLAVIITDSGVGIHPNKLKYIFDGFHQGEETLTKSFDGTGLGLAMSKMVCERLGGEISVYSQLNTGTMVILRVPITNVNGVEPAGSQHVDFDSSNGEQRLCYVDSKDSRNVYCTMPRSRGQLKRLAPIQENEESTSSTAVSTKTGSIDAGLIRSREKLATSESTQLTMNTLRMLSDIATLNVMETPHEEHSSMRSGSTGDCSIAAHLDLKKLRVLIADDNDTIRDIMQRFVNRLGIEQVDLAYDGASVIEKVEHAIVSGTRYSIVFMDLSMPDSGGLEATMAIRRQLGYYCPVVALTGHSDDATANMCTEAGIQRVLVKPVKLQDLAKTISELAVQ